MPFLFDCEWPSIHRRKKFWALASAHAAIFPYRHLSRGALDDDCLMPGARVITRVPKVAGRLRERTDELAADHSAILNHASALLLQFNECYSKLPPASESDLRESLRYTAALWLSALLRGTAQGGGALPDEQIQRHGWCDSLRYEIANIIFQFPQDVESFQRVAEALGSTRRCRELHWHWI